MLVFVYLNGLLVVSELTHSMQDFKLNILARSILTWTALWSLVKDFYGYQIDWLSSNNQIKVRTTMACIIGIKID